LEQRLAELDRWEADIARDPLIRPALEQTAADISAQVASLEDAHLAARFELEDAEALLANLTTRRDQLVVRLNAINQELPGAQAAQATAQQALANAEAEITTHLQDGP
jgi:chromosome segregation ATPase